MSTDSPVERTDIEQLESQIQNLRYAIGFMFAVVLLLTGYQILQWILGYSDRNFSILILFTTVILVLLLSCTIYSMTFGIEKRNSGAPVGTII